MTIQSGTAAVAGTQLYYEIAGSGPALVLVHGFSLDARTWDMQFAILAQHYRVLRYDARGFGRSALPGTDTYSHSEDLRALLDFLQIERAHLMGLSMGGWIITHFALTYPAMARSLTLVDAALIGQPWSPEWKARWGELKTCIAQHGIATARKLWLQHPVCAPAHAASAPLLEQIVDNYSGWHWQNSDPHAPVVPPDIERLDQIAAPTLVIWGADDMEEFCVSAQRYRDNIPGARGAVIAACGHMPNMEVPERFNELVLEFLASLPE